MKLNLKSSLTTRDTSLVFTLELKEKISLNAFCEIGKKKCVQFNINLIICAFLKMSQKFGLYIII